MKRSHKAAAIFAALSLAMAAAALAHPGQTGGGMGMHGNTGMQHAMTRGGMQHGMMGRGMQHGPMAGGMHSGDAAFQADLQLVHEMLAGHDKIKRTVENLPNGIRTVTESEDPQVAQAIKAHVASMEQRLKDGREFNLFSPTIPVLFENKDKIKTTVEVTEKGAVLVQSSGDAKVAAALQVHAAEVSELARDGMAAMHRGMRASMMGTSERQR